MSKYHDQIDVESVLQSATAAFGNRQYVTGIEVALDEDGLSDDQKLVVQVSVKRKLPLDSLAPEDVLPENFGGMPVRVIEARYHVPEDVTSVPEPVASQSRTKRHDPLLPGISVAHKDVSAGTLGMFVRDRASGVVGILSNFHVLAGSTAARVGDPILQPGPFDEGKVGRDSVAHLVSYIIDKDGDAAFARLNGARGIDIRQLGTDRPVSGVRNVRLGDELIKSGRSTGVTKGRVTAMGRYYITYSVGRIGVDGFKIDPRKLGNPDDDEISTGGDSGSIWTDPQTGLGVGLHFAGETSPLPQEEHAIACHLSRVMSRLGLDVYMAEPAMDAKGLKSLFGMAVNMAGDEAIKRQVDSWKRTRQADDGIETGIAAEIDPFAAAVTGFVLGAVTRAAGRQSIEDIAPEALPVVVVSFLAGAVTGAKVLDGDL